MIGGLPRGRLLRLEMWQIDALDGVLHENKMLDSDAAEARRLHEDWEKAEVEMDEHAAMILQKDAGDLSCGSSTVSGAHAAPFSYSVGFNDPELDLPRYKEAYGKVPVSSLAIVLAIEHFSALGHSVMALLPEHHCNGGRGGQHFAHRHELLEPYLDRQLFRIPSRTDDDRLILQEAVRQRGYVLSNDNFDHYVQDGTISKEWRDGAILHYFWLGTALRVESKPGQTQLQLC
ncbi:MAG: hypothetical protein SGPRY_004947 [Prymnesium sp.]